jgi:hypothetical protein
MKEIFKPGWQIQMEVLHKGQLRQQHYQARL